MPNLFIKYNTTFQKYLAKLINNQKILISTPNNIEAKLAFLGELWLLQCALRALNLPMTTLQSSITNFSNDMQTNLAALRKIDPDEAGDLSSTADLGVSAIAPFVLALQNTLDVCNVLTDKIEAVTTYIQQATGNKLGSAVQGIDLTLTSTALKQLATYAQTLLSPASTTQEKMSLSQATATQPKEAAPV